jgi:hypothetical protein
MKLDKEARTMLLSGISRKISENPNGSFVSNRNEADSHIKQIKSVISRDDQKLNDSVHSSVLLLNLREKELLQSQSPKAHFAFYHKREDSDTDVVNDEDYKTYKLKRMSQLERRSSRQTLEGARSKIGSGQFGESNFQTFGYEDRINERGPRRSSNLYLKSVVSQLPLPNKALASKNIPSKLKEEDEDSFESEYQALKSKGKKAYDSTLQAHDQSVVQNESPKANSFHSKSIKASKLNANNDSLKIGKLNFANMIGIPDKNLKSSKSYAESRIPVQPADESNINFNSNSISYATLAYKINQADDDVKSSRGTIKNLLVSATPDLQRQKMTPSQWILSQKKQETGSVNQLYQGSNSEYKRTLFGNLNSKFESNQIQSTYPSNANAFSNTIGLPSDFSKFDRQTFTKNRENTSTHQLSSAYRNNFESRAKISPLTKISQSFSQISNSPILVDQKVLEKYLAREDAQSPMNDVSNFSNDRPTDYNVFLNSIGPQNDKEGQNFDKMFRDFQKAEMAKKDSPNCRKKADIQEPKSLSHRDVYLSSSCQKDKITPGGKSLFPVSLNPPVQQKILRETQRNDLASSRSLNKDVLTKARHVENPKSQPLTGQKPKIPDSYKMFANSRKYKV